ncbi:hypothetical protein D3C81_1285850 [compost metagenome]
MGTEEMLLELIPAICSHGINRNPRGIGGDHRSRLTVLFDLLQKLLLHLQILHNDFNNPVHIPKGGQIILQIPRCNSCRKRLIIEGGRSDLGQPFDC